MLVTIHLGFGRLGDFAFGTWLNKSLSHLLVCNLVPLIAHAVVFNRGWYRHSRDKVVFKEVVYEYRWSQGLFWLEYPPCKNDW